MEIISKGTGLSIEEVKKVLEEGLASTYEWYMRSLKL